MKILRSDMPIELTVLLVILTILFAFIIIPFLIIIGFCWMVRRIVTGFSDGLDLHGKDRRRTRIYEGPDQYGSASRDDGKNDEAASDGDTIDCEVISARTFDENGQEIR